MARSPLLSTNSPLCLAPPTNLLLQNPTSIFKALRDKELLAGAEALPFKAREELKQRLASLWGEVGQLDGTDRGIKLIKGEYYCWDGTNLPTLEQAKSGAGMYWLSTISKAFILTDLCFS